MNEGVLQVVAIAVLLALVWLTALWLRDRWLIKDLFRRHAPADFDLTKQQLDELNETSRFTFIARRAIELPIGGKTRQLIDGWIGTVFFGGRSGPSFERSRAIFIVCDNDEAEEMRGNPGFFRVYSGERYAVVRLNPAMVGRWKTLA